MLTYELPYTNYSLTSWKWTPEMLAICLKATSFFTVSTYSFSELFQITSLSWMRSQSSIFFSVSSSNVLPFFLLAFTTG